MSSKTKKASAKTKNSASSNKKKKKEGTTQTYGQLIHSSKGKKKKQNTESSKTTSSKNQESTVAQQDTVIKLVTDGSETAMDNASIAVAAANDREVVDVSGIREDLDVEYATVVGSSVKSKDEIKRALEEANKVNLSITLKSKQSETVSFNTLKVPDLEGQFTYNFYTPDEAQITLQEDPTKDPLLSVDIFHVPRYVNLTWNASKIVEPLSDQEQHIAKNKNLKRDSFEKNRGVSSNKSSNFKNSYQKSLKKTNTLDRDGVKSELVDIHKLDVAFNATANKKVFPNVICATLNVEEQNNILDSLPIKDLKKSFLRKIKVNNKEIFVKVDFTNRGLAKVFSDIKHLSPDTPDRESVVTIAGALADVKLEKEPADKFQSIPEFLGIDYVGYILEKERFNKDTGEWALIDEYKIIGTEATSFKDTRVAYGQLYRYRIKSVAKLTVRESKEVDVNVEEFLKLIEEKIKQDNIKKHQAVFQQQLQGGITHKKSSGKYSKTVKISQDTNIIIDDSSISMIKDVFEGTSQTLSLISQLTSSKLKENQLQSILNKLSKAKKKIIVQNFSYYYESDPSKVWVYVEVVENIPPPPPSTIKIVPNTLQRNISLYWLKPGNDQRDIAQFAIYKRHRIGEEWTKIATLAENENLFVDTDVELNREYIYAMTCIDAHGLESFLSTQIQAELNPKFAIEKEERKLKWIGGSGATLEEIDSVLKKFYHRREQLVAKENIVLSPNSKFNDASKNYIVKIKSLDTHYETELKVTLKNVNTDSSE